MKKSIATLLVAALLQLPGQVAAQSADELAQKFFDDGAAHYVSGEYARAIVDFRKAFSHVENPIFLYNIALAERNLGQCDAAIATATRAVEMTDTDSATSSRSKGVIAGCQLRDSAVQVAESETTTAVASGDGSTTDGATQPGIGTTAPEPIAGPVAEPGPASAGTSGWTIAGWTLGIVGLSGIVAGSVIGMQLEGTYDEYQSTSDSAIQDEARDELETMRPVALGLLVAGAALATAGIVILTLDIGTDGDEATLELSPDPTKPTVSIRGRF